MTRLSRHHSIETHGGLSVMKSILSIFGVAALAASSAPAMAQTVAQTTDDAEVDVIGNAEAICSLPTSWTFVSAAGGANGGQFSGNTWTIPSTVLASPDGTAVNTTTGYAIRVRGAAMCNTSHEIMITSQNGGLVNTTYAGASPPPLPSGFTWKRDMVYSAQWQDDVTPGTSNNPTPIGANGWGIVNWMPQSAGASDTYLHTIQPPGNRNFDVKMSVRRNGASGPLLAGLYQDVITVTLQPLS